MEKMDMGIKNVIWIPIAVVILIIAVVIIGMFFTKHK